MPSAKDLERARTLFEESEPRDLFYRVALELIDLAKNQVAKVSVPEALAVLLQTWNKRFYDVQYRGRFPEEHFRDIERLLEQHDKCLHAFAGRSIEELDPGEASSVESLVADFEKVLGPVGAAKALHLLAPRFFPLWDNAIAAAMGCRLGKMGTNATRYWRFMEITRAECMELGGEQRWGRGLLKRLDELNYCRYTRGLDV